MLILSLVGALLASLCFGLATVLQAIGMRRGGNLAGAARTWQLPTGVALDTLGFVFELAALRHLPLFLVQSAVAASLAVTAVAASVIMSERLTRRDWLAVAAVCGGLALLGLSAGPEGVSAASSGFYAWLAVSLAVFGLTGAYLARRPGKARTPLLGLCAGFGFGVVAIAARTLPDLAVARLIREPATYLIIASGIVAFLIWTTALASGSVTTATAAMVLGSTVLPAVVGVVVLGDKAHPGFALVAIVGFILAVGGALSLARYGELEI